MINNKIARYISFGSLLSAIVMAPILTVSAAEKKENKKTKGVPYAGTIGAVDKVAKTVTIKTKEKSRTFEITSETKISKTEKPATLDDAVVGEEAAAYGHDEGGKHIAHSLRLGPKSEGKAKGKKKDSDKK